MDIGSVVFFVGEKILDRQVKTQLVKGAPWYTKEELEAPPPKHWKTKQAEQRVMVPLPVLDMDTLKNLRTKYKESKK